MITAHVYQIFYSEQTRAELDPGFEALDNLANPRPDWREYWPIRNHLLNAHLEEDAYYGFLSPKFGEKTGLDAGQVERFVRANAAQADVLIFSPYYDQSAFYLSVFEQGESRHPGSLRTAQDAFAAIGLDVGLEELITDSRTTVFCNYFVARPRFWREWLAINEKLFALAERGDSAIGARLNALTTHAEETVPMKVFVMERIASLLLASQPAWRSLAYSPFLLPLSRRAVSAYQFELALFDSLKTAYLTHAREEYRDAFLRLREVIRGNLLKAGHRLEDL